VLRDVYMGISRQNGVRRLVRTIHGDPIMNRLLNFGALAAFALTASVPTFAQSPEEPEADAVVTRSVRALPPEVSRSLQIARMPMPNSPLLFGTTWLCHALPSGYKICKVALIVCTPDQLHCFEV
jgi:hypothetical protein